MIGATSIALSKDVLPRQLGAYELVELIGRGGMGVVYKARQLSLDRYVAVKILSLSALADQESVHRFRTEAVTAGSLQHPNIVAVHEVGLTEGQHYLVMDYVPGPTLAAVISESGFRTSDFTRSARWVRTIAEAVHFAHEHGILHRDLKPSNVLMDANDQPRVTDFGLAKRLTDWQLSTLNSQLTLSGQVLGSPAFIPPEQASGQRGRVGRRSDVYALGATLYQLLTGRPPFMGEALADTLHQVLTADPLRPRLLNPAVPLDLETVCLKCLEKEPDRRYPTAQALAEELGRWLENRPILARPLGPTAKVLRWCRRNPRLALATGAAWLSLVLGLAGATWQWRVATAERTRAEAVALRAQRNAYAADMNLVQQALDANDLGRARELLDRYRPAGQSLISNFKSQIEEDLRGWEWRYLWGRCRSDELFTLCQYSNTVSALAFSPDGKWMAVRQMDGNVALWDPVAKEAAAQLPGAGWPKALAFAPQGNLLACGGEDGRGSFLVRLWDIGTRNELATLPHPTDVVSVAFSPDAVRLAALDLAGTVHVWDIASRTTQWVLTNRLPVVVDLVAERFSDTASALSLLAEDESSGLGEPGAPPGRRSATLPRTKWDFAGVMLFSPDGRWLAVGDPIPRVQLWDGVTGEAKPPIRLPQTPAGVTAMAFSPDGRWLAVGCGTGGLNLHLWDMEAHRALWQAGVPRSIVSLAFSPDGRRLAGASTDQTVRLWDLDRQEEKYVFRGHTDAVWTIAWSPNGRQLVSGARDGSVRFWDPDQKPRAVYEKLPAEIWIYSLAFLPDSKTFLTVTLPEGEVVSWKTATLEPAERHSFLGTNRLGLDLSCDGRWLALSDRAGRLEIWDFRARRMVTNMAFPPAHQVGAVLFSPHARYFHSGAYAPDRTLRTKWFEVGSWQPFDLHGINLDNCSDLSFAPDERTVAFGYQDGTAAWWDLDTGKRLDYFAGDHTGYVWPRFSPDGRLFVTAGMSDRQFVFRKVAAPQSKTVAGDYRYGVNDIVFSPDGRRVVTSGSSPKGVVKLWDPETGRDVVTLPGDPGLFYRRLGFSPDGNTLHVNTLEGISLFWRAPSWEEIAAAE